MARVLAILPTNTACGHDKKNPLRGAAVFFVSLRCARSVVDGVEASDADIIAAFERVEAARQGTELTYFEFGTLAAAVVFAAENLDAFLAKPSAFVSGTSMSFAGLKKQGDRVNLIAYLDSLDN